MRLPFYAHIFRTVLKFNLNLLVWSTGGEWNTFEGYPSAANVIFYKPSRTCYAKGTSVAQKLLSTFYCSFILFNF